MRTQLSPRDVARAMGVSESSLKRWVDEGQIAATRTAGGHRRISQAEAIRFIRSRSAPLVHPELLGLAELGEIAAGDGAAPGNPVEIESQRLTAALREGRAAEVRGIVIRLYLSGWSVAEICDGPIFLALESIGQIWRTEADGIFVEHRATDLCAQALHQLRSLIVEIEGAPTAVGGAPAGDPHVLGSLMVAAVMSDEGLDPINLGPDTPASALLQAGARHEARFIWLSVGATQPQSHLEAELEELVRGVEDLAGDGSKPSPFLLVGGQQRNQVAGIRHPQLYMGGSLAELVAFVRGAMVGRKT